MAKTLVAYFSETGNTKKVAEAIRDAIVAGGHEAELRDARELAAGDLSEYDLVLLGSACHSSDLAEPVLGLLKAVPPGSHQALAGFATYSSPPPGGSQHDTELYETWAAGCLRSFESAAGEGRVDLLGYFGCQGAPSPPIEEFIRKTILPEAGDWERYIAEARLHPDAADLENAAAFAREVLAEYASRSVGN